MTMLVKLIGYETILFYTFLNWFWEANFWRRKLSTVIEIMQLKFTKFCLKFKDILKAFNDFVSKQKNVWSNVFWYAKVCEYFEIVFNMLYIEIKLKCLKKFPQTKKKMVQKNVLFFLSWAQALHSFTFNLWFLYELKG